jgi:hypothetical protein
MERATAWSIPSLPSHAPYWAGWRTAALVSVTAGLVRRIAPASTSTRLGISRLPPSRGSGCRATPTSIFVGRAPLCVTWPRGCCRGASLRPGCIRSHSARPTRAHLGRQDRRVRPICRPGLPAPDRWFPSPAVTSTCGAPFVREPPGACRGLRRPRAVVLPDGSMPFVRRAYPVEPTTYREITATRLAWRS